MMLYNAAAIVNHFLLSSLPQKKIVMPCVKMMLYFLLRLL